MDHRGQPLWYCRYKVDHEKAYGIKIAGDGAGFNMFAVDGQLERSKIHASSTAVKYSSALGNSTDKTGNNMTAGKQIIHLENTDITNDGLPAPVTVTVSIPAT
ncbi:MAG: hypothetical protein ACLRXQ_03575 [Phascolarctobacterium faecium]